LGLFGVFAARRLTAPQPVKVESLSRSQVLRNRLLFDRDMGDKEAWVALIEKQEKYERLVNNQM